MDDAIGFIGLGNMGFRMAGRLIDAGHDLVVNDVRTQVVQAMEAKGAKPAASPAEVADRCEVVMVSLPMPATVEQVALGEGGLVQGGAIKLCIDLSTTGAQMAQKVAEALGGHDIAMLDAPVSGGTAGAEAGTLAVMVSGPKPQFERVKPALDVIGRVFFIGEGQGHGQTMKLLNNLLSATALAATSEAMVVGVKAGLDPNVMLEVLNAGTGCNSATMDKFPRRILPRKFDAGFTTELMYKDVALCLDEAETLGVPMWVAASVRQIWQYVRSQGGGDSDFTTIVQHIEKWAGVEVKR